LQTLIEDIDLSTVPFADDVLTAFDAREFEFGERCIASVDLAKVAGTMHINYAGKTWGQLKPVPGTLSNWDITNIDIIHQPLKRASSNCKSLHSNPGYYLSDEKKEEWSFYKVGDQYFIAEGNNRTVIGRYFFHLNGLNSVVDGVAVTEATPRIQTGNASRNPLSRLWRWLCDRLRTIGGSSFRP